MPAAEHAPSPDHAAGVNGRNRSLRIGQRPPDDKPQKRDGDQREQQTESAGSRLNRHVLMVALSARDAKLGPVGVSYAGGVA